MSPEPIEWGTITRTATTSIKGQRTLVDHGERRAVIADATLAIIARSGVPAVTIRDVAKESGWSVGTIQYFAGTREQLVKLAWERATDTAFAQIDEVAGQAHHAVDRIVAALTLVLPDRPAQIALSRVFVSFYGQFDAETGENAQAGAYMARWRSIIRDLVEDAQQAGMADRSRTSEAITFELVALVEGLCIVPTIDPGARSLLDANTVAGTIRRLLAPGEG